VNAFYHAAPVTDRPPSLRYRIGRAPGDRWVGVAPQQPLFGPTSVGEVFAFLEWRATDDLLRGTIPLGTVFLHAAGIELASGPVLVLGAPGAGKSTVAAHLLASGHRVWGDDLVRFAAGDLTFSAVPRSFKLDFKSLQQLELVRDICERHAPGMVLAPECWYVSPAAVRDSWEAPPGRPVALVLLDAARHVGPARVEPVSAAEAAVQATQTLLDPAGEEAGEERQLDVRVLESLADVRAYRGQGADPARLARAIEEIAP